MWTSAIYRPGALFSLRAAVSTSSGGRTLLCPTPFALKMALLDALIRTRGVAEGRRWWPTICSLHIQLDLPDRLSVINTFTKIVRPKKNGPSDDDGSGLITPLNRTIAYREYISYGGDLAITMQTDGGDELPDVIRDQLMHITYLGKRGGFMQLLYPPYRMHEDEVRDWIPITEEQDTFPIEGTLQMLDDCAPKLAFERVEIYSDQRMSLGKERILRHVVLPYRLIRSSRGFSLYERIYP